MELHLEGDVEKTKNIFVLLHQIRGRIRNINNFTANKSSPSVAKLKYFLIKRKLQSQRKTGTG
jgi:hypothetical protein